MELENTQNNALAKLPMLKLGEYEMWEIRIKQYFQIQDYALWEVIENGNSWVPIPVTTPSETGTSTATKMTMPSTTEEKTCKKNDVKARSLLLMALPNEHQLTFDQYVDAQSMFAAIKARFGGNEATKKTQKALLKQQYENFSASSSESLDSIFNRLQRLVSRLAILGVVTPPEDLNVKFLRSLPSEWDTHVVVWMNKPDFDTMGLDDLYNNFKIVEQKVKKSAGASNDDKNLAFLTTSVASSTNNINTINPEVSTGTTKVNTASTEISTASFSDATVYAFLSTQSQGSQLVHEDLEQLLSMRARKFYQRTRMKIIIDGSNTAGYDKSKVECFNCHKMGHFTKECRAPRSKDNINWNQGSSSKTVKIEDASEKAMCAIDGTGFNWSGMAEEAIQANMALMAFSDSEDDQDDNDDLAKERDLLASLIAKLNLLQQHAIDLERALQQRQEQIKVLLKECEQHFKIQYLKAQLQDKGIAICELKKLIKNTKGKSVETKFEKPTVKGLNHNLLSVGQFCDADLEVAFQKSTCYIRDLKGNDFLTATLSQTWLWHHRVSYLNFEIINLISKYDIVTGLPKLKFVKDHFSSSYELGKAKRKSFKTKTTPSLKRRLQILHMDICGPMRVERFNGKKYVLVIIDDYSRYTWTHFLRSKDKTPEVLINFLKLVQRGLHAQERTVQTDKGT
ncbi:ribonuclease H-like domain-containing protein [Tanacetum coccineum]